MKEVTSAFMDAIYAKTRQTKVAISFAFVDPEAKLSARFDIVPEESEISKVDQTIDDNYNLIGKVAQFEKNYWRLDGSFILPLPKAQTDKQYGFWTQVLSDENRNYPAGLTMRIYFTEPISIPGLTILFDNKTNNYPTDFILRAWTESMVLIREETITGNNQAHWTFSKGVSAAKYIDIQFLKSSLPHRRIRITEIDFGVMLMFEGSNLFTADLVSEFDPMSETIPDNELNFSGRNDGSFNYTNPESFSKYLQQRQELVYQHSVVLADESEEAVDMGSYALLSWKVSDPKVTMKARLDLTVLENSIFHRYSLMESMSAGALIERIFNDCGWTAYSIADWLYDSPAIVPYTGEVNCKEAIRLVAALSGAVVIKMSTGTIILDRLDFGDDTQAVDTISYNNSLSATQAESSKYYNAITLTITTATARAVSENKPIVSFAGVVSGTEEFIVPYEHVLFDSAPTVSISGATLVAEQRFSNYAVITVTGSGNFTYTIEGNTVDFNTSKETFFAPWYQTGEVVSAYNFASPMMLSTVGDFASVREWCLQEKFRTLSYRLRTESRWRQNPALDIADYLNIQMDKDGGEDKVIATTHTLAYSGGALKGTTSGVGQGVTEQ